MAKVRLQAKTTSKPTSSSSTTTTSSLAPLPSESIGSAGPSYADAAKEKSTAASPSTVTPVKEERTQTAIDVLKKVYKAKVSIFAYHTSLDDHLRLTLTFRWFFSS
jgi:hypothetical protein